MPDSELEDAERLSTVLANLKRRSDTGRATGRSSLASDPATSISAILYEIDQTVLPRTLLFQRSDQRKLSVDVAERRILRWHVGETDMAPPQAGHTEATPSEHAGFFARELADFCAQCSELRLEIRLMASRVSGKNYGISLTELEVHLAEVTHEPPPRKTWDIALEESKAFARAIYSSDVGGPALMLGDQPLIDRLTVLDAAWDDAVCHERCSIWSGPTSREPSVMQVDHREGRIWLAFDEKDLDSCISCWAGVFDTPR